MKTPTPIAPEAMTETRSQRPMGVPLVLRRSAYQGADGDGDGEREQTQGACCDDHARQARLAIAHVSLPWNALSVKFEIMCGLARQHANAQQFDDRATCIDACHFSWLMCPGRARCSRTT